MEAVHDIEGGGRDLPVAGLGQAFDQVLDDGQAHGRVAGAGDIGPAEPCVGEDELAVKLDEVGILLLPHPELVHGLGRGRARVGKERGRVVWAEDDDTVAGHGYSLRWDFAIQYYGCGRSTPRPAITAWPTKTSSRP